MKQFHATPQYADQIRLPHSNAVLTLNAGYDKSSLSSTRIGCKGPNRLLWIAQALPEARGGYI